MEFTTPTPTPTPLQICILWKSLLWEDTGFPGEGAAILQLALAPAKSIVVKAAAVQGHFVLC